MNRYFRMAGRKGGEKGKPLLLSIDFRYSSMQKKGRKERGERRIWRGQPLSPPPIEDKKKGNSTSYSHFLLFFPV